MNRSILKSNSTRQINNSALQTKLSAVGNGIFKKAPSFEVKITNNNEELDRIRETKSESIPNKTQNAGSIRKKSPDKSTKRVQFRDNITNNDQMNNNEEEQEQFSRLLNYDNTGDIPDYRNIFESVTDLKSPESKINENSDNLLTLLATIPPEIADAHEDFFSTNHNFLTKVTTIPELAIVGILLILFFIMILKHFRYDWPSKSSPQLTGSDILMLLGRNFKRMCKNVVPNMLSYF